MSLFRRYLGALCVLLVLSGCATLKDVLMPTPVRCAPKDSPAPPKITSNSQLARFDNYHLILVIGAERLELIDYAGKASAIIAACM